VGGGTRNGPRAIIESSRYVELYDPEVGGEPAAARPALVLLLVFVLLAVGIITAGYLYFRSYEARYRAEVASRRQALIDDISAEAGESEGAFDTLLFNLLKSVVDRINLLPPEMIQAKEIQKKKTLVIASAACVAALVGAMYFKASAEVSTLHDQSKKVQSVIADCQNYQGQGYGR